MDGKCGQVSEAHDPSEATLLSLASKRHHTQMCTECACTRNFSPIYMHTNQRSHTQTNANATMRGRLFVVLDQEQSGRTIRSATSKCNTVATGSILTMELILHLSPGSQIRTTKEQYIRRVNGLLSQNQMHKPHWSRGISLAVTTLPVVFTEVKIEIYPYSVSRTAKYTMHISE